MEKPFDPSTLAGAIRPLSHKKRIAFVLSCAERLAPNYVAFAKYHDWGNANALKRATELAWRVISGELLDAHEVAACALDCERAAPHTENFDSEYVSAALDAANCCICLMELLQCNEVEKVVEAATLARDTIDMQIQDREGISPLDDAREEEILGHPAMQRELARQRHDLELLKTIDLDEKGLEQIAHRWRSDW